MATSEIRSSNLVRAVLLAAMGSFSWAAFGADISAQSLDPAIDRSNVPPVAWMLKPSEIPDSIAAAEAEMKPYTEKIGGTDVTFDLVPIPGGEFVMGSPESEADRGDDEGPQFTAQLEPFWMGKYEITWDAYEMWGMGLDKQRRTILGLKASEYDTLADTITMPTKPYTDMTFGMGRDDCPAICMTQLAAKMFCKWLSAKTGRYYRLPTEAEWEYACRAGTNSAYSFGDEPNDLDDYAWYYDNSDDKYQKVGQKKPNAWGLYDMHGNVAEWVLDGYSSEGYQLFAGKTVKLPLLEPTQINSRVVRGGSWYDDAERLRSAARAASVPEWKAQDPQIPQSIWYLTDADYVGFRVVRPLRSPALAEATRYDIDKLEKADMAEYAEAKGSAAP